MRYFKIADSFKFATEKSWNDRKKKLNSHQTMDSLFSQKKQSCILALFYLLLNIIGFGYSSNHCNLTFSWTNKEDFWCIFVRNMMDWYWFIALHTEKVFLYYGRICVLNNILLSFGGVLETLTFSWTLNNLLWPARNY